MLLLDLGNTRLKWALWDGAVLGPMQACALDPAAPPPALPSAPRAWLAWSSTDPARRAWVDAALARAGIAKIEQVGPPVDDDLLRLAYAEPARLGVDRWLAMRAARRLQSGPVLVASCGSALTVDAVDADGRHLGGTIAASVDAMRAALLARAPHLAGSAGRFATFAARTEDAVHSGALLAAAGVIERLHREATARCGGAPALVLTGGGALDLRPVLSLPSREVPELVLRGVADWVTDTATRTA